MKSSERRLLPALRRTMIGLANPLTRFVTGVVVLTACLGLAPSAAFADLINGIDFAVLGMGGPSFNPSSFQIYQSGTVITGNVGQGAFSGVTHGIDAAINGTWFYDPVNNCGGLPCVNGSVAGGTPVSVTGTVSGGFTQMDMSGIVDTANDQNAAFAALAPTQTFSTLTEGQTILLAPGQNVVAITNAVTLKTTLNLNCPVGNCSVVFQMLATGTAKNVLTLSGTKMNLMGGITPADVVWNLDGPAFSASDIGIQITSSANVIGTFLAPNQGILVDNASVLGEVIGGGNGALLSIHSTSKITAPEFPAPVPDGGMTLMLLGGALVGLESLRRRFRV